MLNNFTLNISLQVTSQLRDYKNIKKSLQLITSNKYDSLLSVYKEDMHPAKNYFSH